MYDVSATQHPAVRTKMTMRPGPVSDPRAELPTPIVVRSTHKGIVHRDSLQSAVASDEPPPRGPQFAYGGAPKVDFS